SVEPTIAARPIAHHQPVSPWYTSQASSGIGTSRATVTWLAVTRGLPGAATANAYTRERAGETPEAAGAPARAAATARAPPSGAHRVPDELWRGAAARYSTRQRATTVVPGGG